jgi:zinc/manganese transport system substrate-binding protein
MMRFIAAALSFALAAVPAAAEPPKVVATFSVLGDMVRNVGGDRVELTTLVGPDGDTELYQPTVADARALAEAKIVIMNGLNPEFEPWLEPLLKQAGFTGLRLVASEGVHTIIAAEEENRGGKAERAGTTIDQHAWHDASNGPVYVRNIVSALAKIDPANAAFYRERGEAYAAELRAVHDWAKTEIATVPKVKRKVITSHDGFQYLARGYGITMLAARGWSNDTEPSAADVARLIAQIRKEKVRAIFVENMNDPRLIKRIASEAGGFIGGTLYSDALSKSGTEADTYVKMMRANIGALKAGMLKN